jgi:hypothetical protein
MPVINSGAGLVVVSKVPVAKPPVKPTPTKPVVTPDKADKSDKGGK